MRHVLAVVAASVAFGALSVRTAQADDRPELALAKTYIQNLNELEKVRAAGDAISERDRTREPDNVNLQFHDCAQNMPKLSGVQENFISDLREIDASKMVFDLVGIMADDDERTKKEYDQLGNACEAAVNGTISTEQRERLAQNMSRLRVMIDSDMDFYDNRSGLMVAELLDLDRPDSSGQTHRFLITRAEIDELVTSIESDFGSRLSDTHPSEVVKAASTLRNWLEKKNFKGSDEP